MKKKDDLYFDNFIECVECSCRAAEILKELVNDFGGDALAVKMDLVHEQENRGDELKHVMMSHLVKAFITPIERDDILKLSQTIDDVTDAIDDIVIRFYTNNITEIRSDCSAFCDLLINCCNLTKELLVEFKNFRKSKTLPEYIVKINGLEESGDRMYIAAMKELHTMVSDAVKIIAWREIYDYFEKCFDACEHVADIVESIAIRNI